MDIGVKGQEVLTFTYTIKEEKFIMNEFSLKYRNFDHAFFNDDTLEVSEIPGYDDYAYMILQLECERFLERTVAIIYDKQRTFIGQLSGYTLNTNEILANPEETFMAMDSISQLLCNAYEFIQENQVLYKDKSKILFLNHIAFEDDHYSNVTEKQVLDVLLSTSDGIIYSLGEVELGDKDFTHYQGEPYFDYWEKELLAANWNHSPEFDFYYKNRLTDNEVWNNSVKEVVFSENNSD